MEGGLWSYGCIVHIVYRNIAVANVCISNFEMSELIVVIGKKTIRSMQIQVRGVLTSFKVGIITGNIPDITHTT